MLTVKQLSKMAGITPRTLHYYDQIGLLKPTRLGENGYRYYGDESLLRLQQVLLYRTLDMPLEQIKEILDRRDFDVVGALEIHKEELHRRIQRMERMLDTVNQTIKHVKGELTMSDKQLFRGLSDEEQAALEQEAMQLYDPETVRESNRKWRNYSAAKKQAILDEGNEVYQEFLVAIPKGAASPEAQAAVVHWRRHMDYFWTPSLEQLVGLAEGYNSDPRFKANFDKVDPRLAEFVREAVKVYVKNQA